LHCITSRLEKNAVKWKCLVFIVYYCNVHCEFVTGIHIILIITNLPPTGYQKKKKCHPQIRWLFVVLRISILSFSFFSFFKCTYQDSNLLLFFTSNIYKLYKTDTTKILYIISTLFFMSNNKRYTVIGPNVQWIFFHDTPLQH
jgi:hypothetical protein